MSADFEIHGADEFYKLSKALKAAGRTGMRNELNKSMRRAAGPLTKVAKAAAADVFPHAGGLDERERKIPFRAVTRTGKDNHGVQIVAPGKWVVAKTTNADGTFRHPVFANGDQTRKQWRWRPQTIPGAAGWFDRAMQGAAPTVRVELQKAIEAVADNIVKGGG